MKSKSYRLLVLAVLSAFVSVFATGCGPMRGVGQDVSYAGDRIEDAAHR